MKRILKSIIAFTMAFFMGVMSLTTTIYADEWKEETWAGTPRPSEPIQISMSTVGHLVELAPGDARQIRYEPIVTGEDGRIFHSRGVMKVTAKDAYDGYQLYKTEDVEYNYTDGYGILGDAKAIKPVKEYEDIIDGDSVYVKIYNIAEATDKLKGETPIKGLDFTLTVPHEARKLADLEVNTEIEVRYDADDLGELEEPEEEPEDKDEQDKPGDTDEPGKPSKPGKPGKPGKPVDSGDVQKALGVSIIILGLGGFIYLSRRKDDE